MPNHTTRRWDTYPAVLRELADHIAAPWKELTDCCYGPHREVGPVGSYSLIEGNEADLEDRVVKIFIMETIDPLPEGVYIGLRSHTINNQIEGRSLKEDRLRDPLFRDRDNNKDFFSIIERNRDTIWFNPDNRVHFNYLCIPEEPSLQYLTNLFGFIERCRKQYAGNCTFA